MNEFTDQALERLKKEYNSVKGTKAGAMKKAVREALESFVRQDDEFAQIRIDSEDGEEIGSFKVGHGSGVYKTEARC